MLQSSSGRKLVTDNLKLVTHNLPLHLCRSQLRSHWKCKANTQERILTSNTNLLALSVNSSRSVQKKITRVFGPVKKRFWPNLVDCINTPVKRPPPSSLDPDSPLNKKGELVTLSCLEGRGNYILSGGGFGNKTTSPQHLPFVALMSVVGKSW